MWKNGWFIKKTAAVSNICPLSWPDLYRTGVSSRYTESYYAERHRMYEKHFDDFLKKYL